MDNEKPLTKLEIRDYETMIENLQAQLVALREENAALNRALREATGADLQLMREVMRLAEKKLPKAAGESPPKV